MDKGAWQTIAHGVAKSDTTEQLSTHTYMRTHTHTHTHIWSQIYYHHDKLLQTQ